MVFEGALLRTPIAREVVKENRLQKERVLTQRISQDVRTCMDTSKPLEARGAAWNNALNNVIDKYFIRLQLAQNIRPAEYKQPTIDKSFIVDERILESYSPILLKRVKRGEIDTQAAFAILEYFLRSDYHNLNEEQINSFSSMFPPMAHQENFGAYKHRVESEAANVIVPNKSPEETWVMRREILDMLEVSNNINRKVLSHTRGKTIYITDLMRISADALHTVHQASSISGMNQINVRDLDALNGNQISTYKKSKMETTLRFLAHPLMLLSMVANPQTRDFRHDMETILDLPEDIHVEGVENIPKSGPVVIAFSHMTDRWKDRQIPSNWELATLIKEVKGKRDSKGIALVAYLNYFIETAPKLLKRQFPWLLDKCVERASQLYDIDMIDVSNANKKGTNFMDSCLNSLNQGKAVLLSPEGVPAEEVLRPQRGIGLLARQSHAPVVGVAFSEEMLSNGSFIHKVIFTKPQTYEADQLPGNSIGQKNQVFADNVMRDIAMALSKDKRGVYTKI